jgi:hypothetical protein
MKKGKFQGDIFYDTQKNTPLFNPRINAPGHTASAASSTPRTATLQCGAHCNKTKRPEQQVLVSPKQQI